MTSEENIRLMAYASSLVQRALLSSRLGEQYEGDRDLYQALGYKKDLQYEDFYVRYLRQDIAKAIIDRPADATWRGSFRISEAGAEEETELEKGWKALDKRLHLASKFKRLDKLTSVGWYGVLFLGFDDVSSGDPTKYREPVVPGRVNNLLYLKPFSEANAEVVQWDTNPGSPRCGLPEIYNLKIKNHDGTLQMNLDVHYSRVLHVAGDLLESESEGQPVLEAVFNRLMDLEKVAGSSGEMFWRGARPGYHGNVDPNTFLSQTAETDLKDKLDEYDHNLRRFLLTQGIDIKPLATQVSDPTQTFDIQIQCICAVTGIPKRILIGSERGELASSEDRNQWLDKITMRREEYAEIQIVRPFVDKMVEMGILPSPIEEGYTIVWTDLYAATEKEQAEIGRLKSETIRSYATSPMAERVMPVPSFLELVLRLNEEERAKVLEQIEELQAKDEFTLTPDEEEILAKERERVAAKKEKTS